MNIESINVMRGPNYWSNFWKKVIVMRLNIGTLENYPTNLIDGFAERLIAQMPSLHQHKSSLGIEGGFFDRVKKGTWMGLVVEHIAQEMQILAGMSCGYSHTRCSAQKGIYTILFSYESERAGVYAAKAAVSFAEALIAGQDHTAQLAEDIVQLKALYARDQFGPSTQSILDEAIARDIPYTRLDNASMVQLGQGRYQKIIRASMTATTSSVGVDIAGDKEKTKRVLSAAFIPVPEGSVISTEEELQQTIESLGFPIVLKPVDGNHGRGITTDINTSEDAVLALHIAQQVSEEVIVERFIQGFDYRFLMINYKLIAVAKRTPAMVIGDSLSTIQQLIDKVNADPQRGEGHEKFLTKIKVDEVTEKILADKQLNLDSILPFGTMLYLKDTANISTGGTARDVTDLVHPHNVQMAERIARLLNLDICGIDVMAQDINVPISSKNGAVLEVNAAPGFRMHLTPSKGIARNVGEAVVDMLYPNNAPARIPVVAVTGTNGKTTTTRLIAHIAKTAGHNVGFTTTDGIYINDYHICQGDCSGSTSAAAIFRDPLVDFAVLECARGGILRSGLGFDRSDISIVTNVSEDHIGLGGIDSIEELAKVKMVVPRTTVNEGYAILNADDDLVYEMRKGLDCLIALFSVDDQNPRIAAHCQKGGLAAFIENEYFVVAKGKWKTRIARVADVPLTFGGSAPCMISNILPAILAATARNFEPRIIATALSSFIPSVATTPGRMNIFPFRNIEVMVDYAHNEGGFIELKKYVEQRPAGYKIGIVAATGDRRDDDIRKIGFYAAQMFDEVIIRDDKDGRGRSSEEMAQLIAEGIMQVNPDMIYHVIPDEWESLQFAVNNALPGSFVLACADNVYKTIEFVQSLQIEEIKDTDQSFKLIKQAS